MLLRKQNYSPKMLDKATSQEISKLLSPLFFCENVMLSMIKRIEEKDLSCMLNTDEISKMKVQEDYYMRQQSSNGKLVLVDFLKAPPPTALSLPATPESQSLSAEGGRQGEATKREKLNSSVRIPKKIGEGRHNPSLKVLTQGSWRKK